MTVIVFDSGVGGLSILREVRVNLPDQRIVYIGDDEGFPYGDWQEPELVERIEQLFNRYITRYQPALAIVACNTASTLIMPTLRARFDIDFVGTVPAIKPAAERTRSKMISVLGTPGTIKRPYTQKLINEFAGGVDVNLVASSQLAKMAEQYMLGGSVDQQLLLQQISPCFQQQNNCQTDIIVLGCTHYPFLAGEMRKVAPWPVDWLDPAEAIAHHAADLLSAKLSNKLPPRQSMRRQTATHDIAVMTSGIVDIAKQKLFTGFGLDLVGDE